jgi:hypothetical protein
MMIMMKKLQFIILGIIFLSFGVLIYFLFRPRNILFFNWLYSIFHDHYIIKNFNFYIPSFFINNLPNALFLLFGYTFFYIIWDNNKMYYYFYIILITILNIIYEIITNDLSDIFTIVITFVICFIIYNKLFWSKI